MDNAHDEFVGGQNYTDSLTVATADGTQQVITVTMTGTNDAAVVTGTSTAALTETNAAQSTGGDLNATDVDSSAAFAVQSNVAGSNGFGHFSIAADGTWAYAMDSAHNEFAGGQTYTDSLTVATADGTQQVLTVSMGGTNDAAVITGTSTAALTETNAAQSTGGDLNASDVDSIATFTEQSGVAGNNGFGHFSIGADGTWTYTMDSAHDEFVGGQTYTDSFTAATVDGTQQMITVTMTGTSDQASTPAVYTGSGDTNDFDTAVSTSSSAVQGTAFGDTINLVGNNADIVNGLGGNDTINAGSGQDTVYAGDGNDVVNGGGQNDILYGQAGSDTIHGDAQNDTVYGGSGNDTLYGDDNNDAVYGGSGADVIDAGGGNDDIVGGYGADQLHGGLGGDTFIFLGTRDTGDTIDDFSVAQGDKLDFHSFAGGVTSYSASGLVAHGVTSFFDAGTGQTIVQVDSDGNTATAELQVQLAGNVTLSTTDFLF
jgi:VCBS repeat-containing protein